MKILVTGAGGFIGRNLIHTLQEIKDIPEMEPGFLVKKILRYDLRNKPKDLDKMAAEADFVFHLAGVNRPQNPEEFMTGNAGLTGALLDALKKAGNKCPVMMSSSIQAEQDNDYGRSKKAGEDLLFEYSRETGAPVLVYRFTNVFGKWSRPDYNSAVATFCHRIARNLPIEIHDPNALIKLTYIDDLMDEMIRAISGTPTRDGDFCKVPLGHEIRVGELARMLRRFKKLRNTLEVPDGLNEFERKLYATYLSFIPLDHLSYHLKSHKDPRGSFTEFLHMPERGQVSVNVTKPGVIKGNHWHHTKHEKFLVVSGQGVIRFRHLISGETASYLVSGEAMTVVDIPPGVTHQIENVGETDLVTLMWASENFDPEYPDTIYCEV